MWRSAAKYVLALSFWRRVAAGTPSLVAARFDIEGGHFTMYFSQPTLRGAMPKDADGDGAFDWIDRGMTKNAGIRFDCRDVLDTQTLWNLGGATPDLECTWQSDSHLQVFLKPWTSVQVGDEICLRHNAIYGLDGLTSPPAFGCIQLAFPDPLLPPDIIVSGSTSVCFPEAFTLNAKDSRRLGGSPTWEWQLAQTDSGVNPEDLSGDSSRVFAGSNLEQLKRSLSVATYENKYDLRLPLSSLEPDAKYTVRLIVTSRWEKVSEQLLELTTKTCQVTGPGATTTRWAPPDQSYVIAGSGDPVRQTTTFLGPRVVYSRAHSLLPLRSLTLVFAALALAGL